MKELIGKLSRGILDYNIPVIETSVNIIELSVEAGRKITGSFDVFTDNGYEMKGIVYSTHDGVSIPDNQFIGNRCTIRYEVSARFCEPEDMIEGRINIVSNCGEIFLPVKIQVTAKSISSSIGEISNLFHFVNLVKQEYEEALKLFLSPEFKEVILGNDISTGSMYEGLVQGADKKRALEEFMIGISKKQPMTFSVSDTRREYDSLTESYGDILLLTRNTWGYQRINVDVEGEFITDCRSWINSEDFAGNTYEFSYLIDIDRLHDGMNYGKITFRTIAETTECIIVVDNIKDRDTVHGEIKRCISSLTRKYLDFRMRNNSLENWAEESLQLIERARGFDDSNPFYKLLQAQVCLSGKRDEEAAWLLESVADEILDRREENIELYCYYLYVRTLQRREMDYTRNALDIIKKYYENGYDSWKLLWLLLFMDSSFENNKSLKIARIKEQYKLGCNSPLMYYEALYVFNKQPALLRVINGFELQVLAFGNRYGAIDLKLAVQISELAMLEKGFRPLLFRVLTGLYEKFENKVILNALLSMLIRGNKTDTRYFKWYALGIAADLKVTRLLEYYVFSMPEDYEGMIPNTVLMYYVYNGNLLYDRESFFYHLIIRNKEKLPNVYKNYQHTIERFALEKLRNREADDYLAEIYADILTPQHITEENVKALIPVLNKWKIVCKNPDMVEVIVIHKEIKGEKHYRIQNRTAYVNIFTEDAIILFADYGGNRYMNTIEYTIEKLFDHRELAEISYEKNADNVYMMAELCEQSLKYHKNIPEGITIFRNVLKHEQFRPEYHDGIMSDVVEFYFSRYDGDDLDEYLRQLDLSKLGRSIRNKVLELMIMRGLYERTADVLKEYGICDIDARRLLKFCSRTIHTYEGREDDDMLKYCVYSFRHGKYNEAVLEYLVRYFNGTTREMMELWRVAKEYGNETRELEERMIAQMLFTRTHLGSIVTIYESYYKKAALPMLKLAYFFFMSYEYFVKEKPIDEIFFLHLEDEMSINDNLHNVCKCAYLRYCAAKNSLSDKAVSICRNAVSALEKDRIIFNFYKKFNEYFPLSGSILDKFIIEYRTEPQDKVYINYVLEQENGMEDSSGQEYITEEMAQPFHGLYTKAFTLFFGENVKYYITEDLGEQKIHTESKCYTLDDRHIEVSSTRFGMLNDILECMELKEESTVQDMIKKYYVMKSLTEQLF